MTTLNEQIVWVEGRQKALKKRGPALVEQGHITQERLSYDLAVINDTLQTLTQLRGLVTRT